MTPEEVNIVPTTLVPMSDVPINYDFAEFVPESPNPYPCNIGPHPEPNLSRNSPSQNSASKSPSPTIPAQPTQIPSQKQITAAQPVIPPPSPTFTRSASDGPRLSALGPVPSASSQPPALQTSLSLYWAEFATVFSRSAH